MLYSLNSRKGVERISKIADEWEAITTNARIRRKHQNQKQKETQKEIEKQEKQEWEKWERERALGY